MNPLDFDEDILLKLKVIELKKLLRDNRQNVSGKKGDLVVRLLGVKKIKQSATILNEDQDENSSTATAETDVTPLDETIPSINSITNWLDIADVTVSASLPPFTDKDLYIYVVLVKKSKRHLRSTVFYEDRHVHSLQFPGVCQDFSHCFVLSKVIPSLPSNSNKQDHNVSTYLYFLIYLYIPSN